MTEKTDNETLLAEGDLVADYLEELLDIADLDGDIENSVSNGRAHVVIDTEDDRAPTVSLRNSRRTYQSARSLSYENIYT